MSRNKNTNLGGKSARRRSLRALIVGGTALLSLALASSASALTIGTTSVPAGAHPEPCSPGAFYVQTATDGSIQGAVPSGGGAINSWSMDSEGDTPGTTVAFLVLRRSGENFTVIGSDTETIPSPLPTSGVATFSIAHPIKAEAGDLIGVAAQSGPILCIYAEGGIPTSDVAVAGPAASVAPGTVLSKSAEGSGIIISVSANLAQSQDVSVSGSTTPASILSGGVSSYQFSVTNNGLGANPIVFADTIPNNLNILAAVAGSGSCATVGQNVSCTLSGLNAGQSAPVSIIVSAPLPGTYVNTATVSSELPDPNPANNTASTTLLVSPLVVPVAPCKTVQLKGLTLSLAKTIISASGCKVGKVGKASSKKIKKGLVISTNPGAGKTLAGGSAVAVTISSGPPKKKKKGKGKH